MQNLVVLISGRGSNLLALTRECRIQRWPARVAAVLSNRADAAGLREARVAGIPVEVLDHRRWSERAQFDAALADAVAAHSPHWVLLAGFMRVLGPAFVDRFPSRVLNIHPSLLPSFAGLHTHRRALEAGVRAHGATVHMVGAQLDAGPIIAQAVVPVLEGDDEQRLADRVLAAEHRLYPTVVRWLVEGDMTLSESGPTWRPGAVPQPRCLWLGERPGAR